MTEAKASKTEYTEVAMDDGTTQRFPSKRKLIKESNISEDGFTVTTKFYFRNGEVRQHVVEANKDLFARFVAHGVEQKVGDEVAGLDDVEDMILAVEKVIDRLHGGSWVAERESSGLAGTSTLARALIEATGKSPAEIKDFLANKSVAEKRALRANSKIAPIVERLEANKKKKEPVSVDTDSMLDELAA